MDKQRPRLLGISGSIRRDSLNTALLKALQVEIEPTINMVVFTLDQLPLYNEDLDHSPPAAVQEFRDVIRSADGVIIATPEYNYGMSGVLKNALDWASRPYGNSVLTAKPTLTLSSSPASTGGVRAQAQLNETLICIGAQILIRPQIVIGAAHERIKEGRVMERSTLDFLLAGIEDLVVSIKHHKAFVKQEA